MALFLLYCWWSQATPEQVLEDPKNPSQQKFKVDEIVKQDIQAQVKIILDNGPTWREKSLLENVLRFFGIVLFFPAVLLWNEHQDERYKNDVLKTTHDLDRALPTVTVRC